MTVTSMCSVEGPKALQFLWLFLPFCGTSGQLRGSCQWQLVNWLWHLQSCHDHFKGILFTPQVVPKHDTQLVA